ncbi:unnamed protein product [Cuscuta campestris]|uniref:Uncharacterized protein n=1 Tax=Cuscuta campestris TaxID=132261 RepID=A0A484NR34_9ASTE|nr:unnamed protein product [Cuscuta campestris]
MLLFIVDIGVPIHSVLSQFEGQSFRLWTVFVCPNKSSLSLFAASSSSSSRRRAPLRRYYFLSTLFLLPLACITITLRD